jgi:PTH1 family peptidyl-tRNA hydrolase
LLRLVAGLGNPGRKYQGTRHNVGFLVVEELRRRAGGPDESERAGALRCALPMGTREVMLLRPVEYMNRSGGPLKAAMTKLGAEPDEVLVVSDDFWLPFGTLRLRRSGSHGGHNGLRSIFESLGTNEVPRLRIGIGPAPEGADQAEFVLEPFTRAERGELDEVIGRAADCVEAVALEGLQAAMNRYNRGPAAAAEE